MSASILSTFVRSYRLHLFAAGAIAVALISALMPARPVAVPLREAVMADPWPLTLATLAVCLPMVLSSPDPVLEANMPIAAWRTRLDVALGANVIALIMFVMSSQMLSRPWDQALRNYAFAVVACLLLVQFVRIEQAWLGPAALILGNWLYGIDDDLGVARWWAVLMYGSGAPLLISAIVAMTLSFMCWVKWGSAADRKRLSGKRAGTW